MKFRKTNYNNRTTYTYKFVTGEKLTLAPGNADVEITVDLIKYLHSLDDSEVYNNRKNCKPPLSDEEKAVVHKWEEAHPGEEFPKNWTLSLDTFSEDPDSDMDRSSIIRDVYEKANEKKHAVTRLWEIIDKMSDRQRRVFIMVELDGYTMTETADKLGCSIANVSKLIARAKTFIKENY